jgi:hypothetical protein
VSHLVALGHDRGKLGTEAGNLARGEFTCRRAGSSGINWFLDWDGVIGCELFPARAAEKVIVWAERFECRKRGVIKRAHVAAANEASDEFLRHARLEAAGDDHLAPRPTRRKGALELSFAVPTRRRPRVADAPEAVPGDAVLPVLEALALGVRRRAQHHAHFTPSLGHALCGGQQGGGGT